MLFILLEIFVVHIAGEQKKNHFSKVLDVSLPSSETRFFPVPHQLRVPKSGATIWGFIFWLLIYIQSNIESRRKSIYLLQLIVDGNYNWLEIHNRLFARNRKKCTHGLSLQLKLEQKKWAIFCKHRLNVKIVIVFILLQKKLEAASVSLWSFFLHFFLPFLLAFFALY